MRKFYTRLFSVIVLSMVSLMATAQLNPPTLNPADGACDIGVRQQFTLTFDEDVFPVKGQTVSLNSPTGIEYIPIQFWWEAGDPVKMTDSGVLPMGDGTTAMWSYEFAGNTLTIDFFGAGTYELSEATHYYVTISNNAIRNADGDMMAGLAGSGPLTCGNDAGYGWDVTVGDFQAPEVLTLNPADEATDAAGNTVTVTLNEDVQWTFDATIGTRLWAGDLEDHLALGDIALYTSTDPILGQYGGDVIFTNPEQVDITDEVITITWPEDMPDLTNVYVRIKEGLFEEIDDCCNSPLPWNGFNGNGQTHLLGDNGDWNFTTKDSRAPEVTITRSGCEQNATFTITLDETGIVVANNITVPLTSAIAKNYVTFDDGQGGDFTATVEVVGGNTVITVTPKQNLPSETSVTVGLTAGLWDASHNNVPSTSATFMTGDYVAPDISSVLSANWDGTSFDLEGNIDEDATLYYIVQLKSVPVEPTAEDIYNIATGAATSYTVGTGTSAVTVKTDLVADPSMDEGIWAAGFFTVDGGDDFIHRIRYLERTHGTEFRVFVIGIDNSACGPYNGWAGLSDDGWVSGVRGIDSHIIDILPPVVEEWYADLVDADDDDYPDGCTDDDNDGKWGIKRGGAVYAQFNEEIRLADGTAITSASLADVFVLKVNGNPVNIDEVRSFYDEDNFLVVLYPEVSFLSGSTVTAELSGGTVEDDDDPNPLFGEGGVEQNNLLQSGEFCVEEYCPPILTWFADEWVAIGDTAWHDDPNEITDCDGSEVTTNATVVVDAGRQLFVPGTGLLEPVTNDNVHKYVKIRRSSTSCDMARIGTIIYQDGNVADFDITITNDGVITIVPNGFTYDPETWYNIEIHTGLQNADRQTIADGEGMTSCGAPDPVNNLSFFTSDDAAPEVFFFEADQVSQIFEDPILNCEDPLEMIDEEDRIGVRITEWVEIGFDGFGVLEPTETIADANALRRYLSLTGPAGPIQFDVEDFSVDATGDVAEFYVDPYNYPDQGDEDPNWVAGEEYEICWISNPDEYQEGGDPYGPGALMDDHGNIVPVTCACFEIEGEPEEPLSCEPVITVGPEVCGGVTSILEDIVVTFTFENAMVGNPDWGYPGSGWIWISVYDTINDIELQIVPLEVTEVKNQGRIYIARMEDGYDDVEGITLTPGLVYIITVTEEAFIPVDSDVACDYWPVGDILWSAEVPVGSFQIGDDVPPTISSLVPADEGEIEMDDDLVINWSEDVLPVNGQVIEIFEKATNDMIAQIDIADCDIDDEVVTIPNAYFKTDLAYNTCYYAQFNAGLVKDTCDNLTEEERLGTPHEGGDKWEFCIGDDPAPEIVCGDLVPENLDNIQETQPLMSITFTEPVWPVDGSYVQVYEAGTATSVYIQFATADMTPNADRTVWSIETSDVFPQLGREEFVYGDCYEVNVDEGAFKELSGGNQTTEKIVTQTTFAEPVQTACTWTFCVLDDIPPTVDWWPVEHSSSADYEQHIPTNAHLFAYLDQPVELVDGTDVRHLTEEDAAKYFQLRKRESLTEGAWSTPIEFVLEFIDDDKQEVRITPLDTDAPDVQTATMEGEMWYKLEVSSTDFTATMPHVMQDENGNPVVASETIFRTEDIDCPEIVGTPVIDNIGPDGFDLDVTINEKGTVYYVVVPDGVAAPSIEDVRAANGVGLGLASGKAATDAGGSVSFTITGLSADEASGYDFEVYVYSEDDEIDRWPKNDPNEAFKAEWPYTNGLVPMNEPSWIHDVHPAPNYCQDEVMSYDVTLCDDDEPYVLGSYPRHPDYDPLGADTWVPVDAEFWLALSEPVGLGMMFDVNPTTPPHHRITLRDYENNLAIPCDFSLSASRDTIFFYPQADLDQPWTLNGTGVQVDLMGEHRYYIEIERYAVYDVCEGSYASPADPQQTDSYQYQPSSDCLCDDEFNFLDELIGKAWWFKTMDNVPPQVLCDEVLPQGECVDDSEPITVVVSDGNPVTVNSGLTGDSAYVYIYIDGEIDPHERIPLSYFTGPTIDGDEYTFTFPTSYHYLSNTCYRVRVPAGAFIDSYNNVSEYGCWWTFCTKDYEAPVAHWRLYEDYSYLFNVYMDPQYFLYYPEETVGLPGAILSDIPTSSYIEVGFDELVAAWDTSANGGLGDWEDLMNLNVSGLTFADLSDNLVITRDGVELLYGRDYWLMRSPTDPETRFVVVIADDYSHYGHGTDDYTWSCLGELGNPDLDCYNLLDDCTECTEDLYSYYEYIMATCGDNLEEWFADLLESIFGTHPYVKGSMQSNATYNVSLKEARFADQEMCDTRNVVTQGTDLLTLTTRDDTPPQLTMKDATGNILCDTSCYSTRFNNAFNPLVLSLFQADLQIGSSLWPGLESSEPCNVCVVEGPYIELAFDKPIVKTPGDVAALWPWGEMGVNWWTEANLHLDEEDFIPADGSLSKYFRMAQYGTTSTETCGGLGSEDLPYLYGWVEFDHVEIIGDSIFRLYLPDNLSSQGIYQATFAPYLVKDQVRVPDGNEFLGLTCTFIVRDYSEPEVCSVAEEVNGEFNWHSTFLSDPGAMERDTCSDLAMSFSEAVHIGVDKELIIRSRNGQQRWIVNSNNVTYADLSMRKIIIPVDSCFREFTQYYVEIEEGFVTDTVSRLCGGTDNPYAGMNPEVDNPFSPSQAFEWSFKTGDMTPPQALVYYPNHTIYAPKDSKLRIKMDENIFDDCNDDPSVASGIYIYEDNGAVPHYDFGNFIEFIPWDSPAIEISGTDVYNGMTSDSVTITPQLLEEGGWKTNQRYYIRLSDDMWCDGTFGNYYAGVGDTTTWEFTITNDVAPILASATPVHDVEAGVVCDDPAVTVDPHGFALVDLMMTFVDDLGNPLEVAPGSGKVKIFEYIYNPILFDYEEKLWRTIDVSELTFAGNTVSINDIPVRDEINMENSCGDIGFYYVTVDPGTVTNGFPGSLTFWDGIDNAFEWRFMTCADDVFVDGFEIVSPLGDNWTVADASTLVMDFSAAEAIEAIPGTTATVNIHLAADSSIVDQITVVPGNITGHMLELTTTALAEQTEYFVTIDEGAFGDTSTCSTPFPGWDDAETWTFATGDHTAPIALLEPVGDCVDTCVTLTFTFDENGLMYEGVTPAEGMVRLWVDGVEVAAENVVATEDPNIVTATFCGLTDTTIYDVSMDSATVVDNGPNANANELRIDPTWSFTTGDNTDPQFVAWGPEGTGLDETVVLSVTTDEAVLPNSEVTLNGVAVNGVWTSPDSAAGTTWEMVVDTELEDNTEYTVVVADSAFVDYSCNPNYTPELTWTFTTDDNTAPTFVANFPEEDAVLGTYLGVLAQGISFTASEPVVVGEGNITVESTEYVIPSDSSIVEISEDGLTVTVWLTQHLTFEAHNVAIDAGAFVDLAETPNGNVAYDWDFTIEDNIGPGEGCDMVFAPEDGSLGIGQDTTLVMEFCEIVVPGLPDAKVRLYELDETSLNKLFEDYVITEEMIAGNVVTIPVTGLKDWTSFGVLVDEGAVMDEAGNAYTGIFDPTFWNFTTGDLTPPVATITAPDETENLPYQFDVVVNFSEPVTNVDLTTILVTGGEATVAMNEAGDEATVSIDAEQGAEVTVTVTTAITDIPHERGVSGELVEVANNLVAEVSETYVVGDWTAPELLSMTPEEDNNTETEFTVELVFSEEVEGVEESVTVEGGTLVDVEVDEADAKVYHVMVEGEDLDSITVTVDPAGIDDGPVNNNGLVLAEGVDGVGEYVVGDHVAPEIVSVVADVDDVENTPQAFTVDITFSEAVENTDLGITVDGAAAVYTVAGNVYTVEIEGEDGDVITLAVTDVITDVSINENPLANPGTWVYTVGDNTPPVVEVYKPSATDTINEFDLTITFNEEVTGVDVNSVTVTGVTPVDPEVELRVVLSGLVYEATINAIDGDEVTLSFSDAIEDLAGNPLVPASFVYTIANEAPTVMADPAEGVNLENGDHTVTLTFSEPVLNAETGVVVTNALSSSIAMVSETVYEVTFEGAEESTVEIEVTDAVTDLAGEPVVPVTFTYQIDDNTAPEIVSVIPQGENATANTFVLDIVFSEPVWGTAEGMSIMGGTGMTITTGEDGDQIYQVTITGNDGDDIILTIGDEIVDGAGIPNPLAEEGTFYYTVGDNTPPTLEVTTLPDPQQTEFDVMLTFSEEVTGVGHTGYISITNGEITNINGSEGDKVYILTIAAEEEAEVLLQLSTYIKDLAGNAFAGESMTFEVGDWTAPAATAMTPEGELEEDDTTFDLVLTLDEDVVAGSGNLTVMDDNGAFLTFTPAEVTISGNTVTVPVVLDKYTTYRVVVDEGFVTDEAGNDFEGVADGDWTFTTKNFAVGIDSKEYTYKVYPNPFNDYVTIDNAHRLSRVVISNIAGQRVIDVMYPEQVVRTPNLVSGAYLITLFTEEGIVKTERIVKR